MKMRTDYMIIATAVFALSACGAAEAQHAPLEPESIGRFAYHPPSGDMPAVLLDTATGCVEVFNKVTSVENERDITWWRQYLDVSMPLRSYDEESETGFIEGSAPPKRCPQAGESKK